MYIWEWEDTDHHRNRALNTLRLRVLIVCRTSWPVCGGLRGCGMLSGQKSPKVLLDAGLGFGILRRSTTYIHVGVRRHDDYRFSGQTAYVHLGNCSCVALPTHVHVGRCTRGIRLSLAKTQLISLNKS